MHKHRTGCIRERSTHHECPLGSDLGKGTFVSEKWQLWTFLYKTVPQFLCLKMTMQRKKSNRQEVIYSECHFLKRNISALKGHILTVLKLAYTLQWYSFSHCPYFGQIMLIHKISGDVDVVFFSLICQYLSKNLSSARLVLDFVYSVKHSLITL